ncbi:Cell wall-associated hydrolase, NlpC family [Friedmanniella luteola]|uniref:Cell wall-associated hydrolase, NlpC family n=1 Tax=Friedmanniella luteola TaxID=546871 RepID=A0A1H1Z3X8_9ACTN|nr:peptidoglycan-binding protein [Friedmanniella luteola]SDT28313.1 Cell wall-associated hydrolase, NlpC family [Friedmanniella luteola]
MGKILMRAASLATGLALAVSVTATAELPASAASTCSASFSRYQVISKGSKGSQAKAMECLLRKAGYSATVNGSFSVHDAAKLARFRRSVGLSPLKVAGPRPWSALLSQGSRPALERGDKGADVLRLQRSLRALGYTKVTLTSYFGANTVAAVKSAQKKRGQKQTGRATTAVWSALQHGRVAAVPAPKKAVAKKTASRASSSSKGAKALAFAKRQIGDSYRYGATGPNSWDCSGLTGGAWKAAGVKIPRTSQAQYRAGKKVAKSDLKPGDLVFFYSGISHVGIYAGSGNVIHASRPGQPVAKIKMKYMPYQGARRYS